MQDKMAKLAHHTRAWPGFLLLILGALMVIAIMRSALFGGLDAQKHFLVELSLLLLIAVIAERLVATSRQSFAMVLLILGVFISPYTVHLIWPAIAQAFGSVGIRLDLLAMPTLVSEGELMRNFANLGAIILLFRIGLHSKLEHVFNSKNLAIAAGGVALPFAAGFLFAQYTGGSFAYSLFLGAALTATSVGITVAVLEEMKLVDRPFAQAILGAAVIDDILALMVLGSIRSMPSELTIDAIIPSLGMLWIAAVFVFTGIVLGRLFVMKYFAQDEPEISKRTLSGLLALLFFYAFASESLGLSAIVGAFLSGLVIGYSPISQRLVRALFPLDVIFTPIFFISLGMLIDIGAMPAVLGAIGMLSLIAIASKLVGCAIPALAFGAKPEEAAAIGAGMAPRGEIALIIAALAIGSVDLAGNPIMTGAQYTLVASMAFITTLAAPVMLKMLLGRRGAFA